MLDFLEINEATPVIDYKGKQEGELLVELVPHQCGDMNLMADNFDDDGEWSVSDFIGKVRGGRRNEPCMILVSVLSMIVNRDPIALSSPSY